MTLVDTGVETMTGGRIRRIARYIADDESFCLTYADGVADVDIRCLIAAHINGGTLATVTAVQTPGKFGRLTLEDKRVVGFAEKYPGDGGWVNAGYFVLSTRILDYIEDDSVIWERAPIERLVREGQLSAYRHDGFWHCMDTPKDRQYLENLWAKGQAPWLVW